MRLVAELAILATAIAYGYLKGWLDGYDTGTDRAIDLRDRLGD